jgi:predicted DNA-binding ribbon-helix-helix protein
MISDQEAKEMVNLASRLRQEVEEWLLENHPDLIEE